MQCESSSLFQAAVDAANTADVVVLAMGLDSTVEGLLCYLHLFLHSFRSIYELVSYFVHSLQTPVIILKDFFFVAAEAMDRVQTKCNGVNVDIYGLPGCQEMLVEAVAASQASCVERKLTSLIDTLLCRHIVMVLMHGGGVPIANELSSPRISSIIDVFYPGYGPTECD